MTDAFDVPFIERKLGVTLFTLVLTLAFAFLPWLIHRGTKSVKVMSLCNCFAGGVIIGALLFDLIPHAIGDHEHNHGAHDLAHAHAGHAPVAAALGLDLHDVSVHGHDHTAHHDHDHAHEHHENGCCHASKTCNGSHSANTLPLTGAALHSESHEGHLHEEGEEEGEPYSWGALSAGVSFIFLLALDRMFLTHNHCPNQASNDIPLSLTPSNSTEALGRVGPAPLQGKDLEAAAEAACTDADPCNAAPIDAIGADGAADGDDDDHSSCHSADMMGGCHLDGITENTTKTQAFMFVLALSMHSFLEGLIFADLNTHSEFMSGSLSLLLHKFLEAFALGVNVFKAGFKRGMILLLIIFYSVLTPLGILLGIYLFKSRNATLMKVLNGLAVGSFLFVSCIEMISPEFHKVDHLTKYRVLFLTAGFALVAIASIFSH